jgi:hypothetical protein
MARARNGVNQRGTYGRKPVGPIGKRPTPRTGGGMKLPTRKVRPPRPSDTGGGMRPPKRIRPPRPSDTGGGLRPRRRPNPRRARAVAQQRNVSRRRR